MCSPDLLISCIPCFVINYHVLILTIKLYNPNCSLTLQNGRLPVFYLKSMFLKSLFVRKHFENLSCWISPRTIWILSLNTENDLPNKLFLVLSRPQHSHSSYLSALAMYTICLFILNWVINHGYIICGVFVSNITIII